MQQWLRERQAEYARAAQMRLCKKCGAPVLIGLDADIAALKVEIDPTPITETGEALALLRGRGTYELHRARGARQIHHRAEWNIAAPRERAVFPAHRCGQELTAHLDSRWAQKAPERPQTPDDTPPY